MAGGYSPITGSLTYASSGAFGTTAGLAGIQLEPTARTTTIMLAGTSNVTSTSTLSGPGFAVEIQATLDTWLPGGVTQNWQSLSSFVYNLGAGVVSSAAGGASTNASSQGGLPTVDGAFISVLGPIAGVRLALLSTNGFGGNTTVSSFGAGVTLKTLQSVTAGP